jgi:hypothetical protein
MTDLMKGVLGGGWTLLLGWIFPSFLSVVVFGWLVAPAVSRYEPVASVHRASVTTQSLIAIGVAATFGVVLSAMQTPLYRILEGYLLWPAKIADRRRRAHVAIRAQLAERGEEAVGYRAGLAEERRRRYPDSPDEFAPTALGNAIRRFEVYGWDRYRLNTQVLWYRLQAVVEDRTSKAVDTARANVDFFVCLLYTQMIVALTAVVALSVSRGHLGALSSCIALSLSLSAVSYRLAVVATDEWASAVRAMTDLGRVPLAKALGLMLPPTLKEERQMWGGVYFLDREPYSDGASDFLSPYRATPQKEE